MNKSINIIKPILMVTFMSVLLSSCITIIDQGPRGENGKVFYGIDYDYNPPYSYWDNNQNIPLNPYFGELYRTQSGTYDFEYFINPYEYWYGTYTLYMNLGEPGGDYGAHGRNGEDTFLLLICNDDGFYYDGWEEHSWHKTVEEDGTITISGEDKEHGKFEIKMKKETVTSRAPEGTPKFKRAD